eukprot:scaffold10828_cov143-Isochrysis_galbana.AAC.3
MAVWTMDRQYRSTPWLMLAELGSLRIRSAKKTVRRCHSGTRHTSQLRGPDHPTSCILSSSHGLRPSDRELGLSSGPGAWRSELCAQIVAVVLRVPAGVSRCAAAPFVSWASPAWRLQAAAPPAALSAGVRC